MLLNGDTEALRRYLAGERFGVVAEHYAALGLADVLQKLQDEQSRQTRDDLHGASARIARMLAQ